MNEKEANEFVESTFRSEYDDEKFLRFIKELLNGGELKYGSITPVKAPSFYKGKKNNPYSEFIRSCRMFGVHVDSSKKRILFLSVNLIRQTSRDRARIMQRNFAADALRGSFGFTSGGDAALIAFYDDNKEDWRLSFVTLETTIDWTEEGYKTYDILSPAKRFSYLVGVHEPCHTCMKRLSPLIARDTGVPTLDEIADVFHIETVTSEFFDEYKERYLELTESLQDVIDNDSVVRAEFERKGIIASDFSKKLLGQIVFLYFLQKKGWLGVKKGENWGSGPKNFMSQLFSGDIIPYNNFFDEVLEPLFYKALNSRNNDDYYSGFDRRIPFLNGGLFENNYDWENTNITIDNSVFKKIFDTFNQYNFTIKEDEPLEREVAVDPEMLGKVFENLLEINNRKAKGAFYTPRNIVHYICQQALIEYLVKNIDGTNSADDKLRSDVELFVQKGDEMYAAMYRHTLDVTFSHGDSVSSEGVLPENISSRAEMIDDLLRDIKIADPAVGSGAFPVGMMNEIVKARTALTFCLDEDKQKRTSYNLKRETIENSIYGVDLDSSAVDIAKLRFWLSLIVDEENPKEIQPLPNLDHKIMAGNSLIENFVGVKLFDKAISDSLDDSMEELEEIDLRIEQLMSELNALTELGSETKKSKGLEDEKKGLLKRRLTILRGDVSTNKRAKVNKNESLSPSKIRAYKKARKGLKEYQILQRQYFNEQDRFKKQELKEKMDVIEWDLIENVAEESNNPKLLAELKKLKGKKVKPFFLWELYFSEVFSRKNPGFDCVIGNPPYVQLQKIDVDTKKNYEDAGFSTYVATGDLYCLFYEKGYQLLRDGGTLGYITSNKWMRAGYGNKLRGFFATKTNPITLIDFAGTKIFEEATVDVNIMIFRKEDNQKETQCLLAKKDDIEKLSDSVRQGTCCNFDSDDSWVILSPIEKQIKDKIEKVGTPLKDWDIQINYGIKTGYNDAFIIDGETKDELIAEDPKSAEIIRPILRGRDIKRYSYEDHDLWLIATFPSMHYNIDDYPSVKKYLLSFGIEKLEQTGKEYVIDGVKIKSRKKTHNKWFETQDSIGYWEDFLQPKIIFQEMVQESSFFYDENTHFMCLDTGRIIVGDNLKYVLAIMNSKLFFYSVKHFYGGGGLGDKGVRMKHTFFENYPCIVPSKEIGKEIVDLVTLRNNNDMVESKELERKIDIAIYNLYGLTEDEIDTIEKNI